MKPLTKKQYKTIRKWIKINYSLLCEKSLLGLFDFHFKPKPQTGEEMLAIFKANAEKKRVEAAKIARQIIKDACKNMLKDFPDDEVPPDKLDFTCI